MKETKENKTVAPNGEAEQPAWRRDFPIDWEQDNYVARRDFTKFLTLTSFAFVAGQFWIGIKSLFQKQKLPLIKQVTKVNEIKVGESKVFSYPLPEDKCVLVRLDEQNFVAYNQACTHLSCPVIPDPKADCLRCPCHQGLFDLKTGRPMAGPPRRPLPRIQLEIREGQIYAIGVEEQVI
ncbi:MAG: ubiquinol-cytochrome c reductase iron-sulfur subunit [Blastocatellia bacterium]|nr:ubiquinol-cytochrome c reductase iron-sulfur subunit [Blastocatellia bacterium]MBN8724255.1 ubiquinol-cytochrome c reductase iron-sulfur subunit [Acidobacteriota bacterium]